MAPGTSTFAATRATKQGRGASSHSHFSLLKIVHGSLLGGSVPMADTRQRHTFTTRGGEGYSKSRRSRTIIRDSCGNVHLNTVEHGHHVADEGQRPLPFQTLLLEMSVAGCHHRLSNQHVRFKRLRVQEEGVENGFTLIEGWSLSAHSIKHFSAAFRSTKKLNRLPSASPKTLRCSQGKPGDG